jgi:hypothetical protein
MVVEIYGEWNAFIRGAVIKLLQIPLAQIEIS